MAYSERLLENQERLSMRDMRLRVAKLILRGVASSTIAQAEGYPSYTARELSSYFSYSSISISSKPEPELLLLPTTRKHISDGHPSSSSSSSSSSRVE